MNLDLKLIETAYQKIKPYIRKTPLVYNDYLSQKYQKEVWLKCENFQKTGSFKFRGATNFILAHLDKAKKHGVITASAGNHAQGVAAICQILNIPATIVMPTATPALKIQNTQNYGAKVELVGNIYDESYEHALNLAKKNSLLYVPAFKSEEVMAGQGTVALEVLDDLKDFDAIVSSVGGSGLINGIGTVLKTKLPKTKVYACGSQNAPSLYKSFHSGEIEVVPIKHTIAEGAATKKPEVEMIEILRKVIDNFFSLSEVSISNAITILCEKAKMVAEGAGALPIAALTENCIPEKKIVLVISGGNIDIATLSSVLQRGLVDQGRILRLLIKVPDRPGSLNSITQIIAGLNANIIQVIHQRSTHRLTVGETEIQVDVETRGLEHSSEITNALTKDGFIVKLNP